MMNRNWLPSIIAVAFMLASACASGQQHIVETSYPDDMIISETADKASGRMEPSQLPAMSVFETVVQSVVNDQLRGAGDVRVDPRELEVVSPYVFEPHADRINASPELSADRGAVLKRLRVPEGDAVAAMDCFLGADPDVLPRAVLREVTEACSDFGPYTVLVTSPTEYSGDSRRATIYLIEIGISPKLGTWEAIRYSLQWSAESNAWRIVDQVVKAAAN